MKTCQRGHPQTPENTRVRKHSKNGRTYLSCRVCEIKRDRTWKTENPDRDIARPSTPPQHHPEWPPERIEQLRALWAEGLSTQKIGDKMGITKSAVVGKAHRLFLAARPSPIKRGAEPKPPARPRARVTLPPLPSVHPAAVKARRRDVMAQIKALHAGGTSRAILAADGEFDGDDRPAITALVRQVANGAAPPPPRGTCCWLFGERGAYRQCEAVAVRGSYCEPHAKRAYQPRAA